MELNHTSIHVSASPDNLVTKRISENSDDEVNYRSVPTEFAETFQVRDDASANWVVRKVNEARAYGRSVEEWAAAELKRARTDEAYFLTRFGPQLEAWLRQQIEDRRLRRKSIALPAGTVGFRRSQPRLHIVDEAASTSWVKTHLPTALRTTISASGHDGADILAWCREHCRGAVAEQSVLKNDLNEYVATTGELPDGVEVSATPDRLYIS